MKLSFMIPTRNQAQFIGQCIEGCLAQQIADSEIVVVDGASTDHTVEVLRSYGDRIRWVSEKDRGQSDAINKGVRMAQGELVAWINSDDYYASAHVVQRLVDAFASDPQLDIAYGDGERVDVDGKYLGPYRARAIERVAQIVTQPASFVLQPSLMFRRQLFLDHIGMARIGDDDGSSETLAFCAPGSQLEHGFLGGQRQHLFGSFGRRHRP